MECSHTYADSFPLCEMGEPDVAPLTRGWMEPKSRALHNKGCSEEGLGWPSHVVMDMPRLGDACL